MRIDTEKIGRDVVEQLLNEASPDVGPCFFPGVFKPPHRGDFEAAKYLAEKPYINRVYVIVSNVAKNEMTAQDSLYIWNEYFKADPDPKIKIIVSKESSPVKDAYSFIKTHPDVDPIYIAAKADEIKDDNDFGNLKKNFSNKVRMESIPNEYLSVNSEDMLSAAKSGDYETFLKYIPNIVYNKGAGKDIFAKLGGKKKDNLSEVKKNNMYTVYFDIDDTLTDYSQRLIALKNRKVKDKETGEYRPGRAGDTVEDIDFWINANWLSGSKSMLDYAINNFDRVEFLSAIPDPNNYAAPRDGKLKWLENNGYKHLKAHWSVGKKQKGEWANSNAILIDDKLENIKNFQAQGGIGILMTNPADVIKQLKKYLV